MSVPTYKHVLSQGCCLSLHLLIIARDKIIEDLRQAYGDKVGVPAAINIHVSSCGEKFLRSQIDEGAWISPLSPWLNIDVHREYADDEWCIEFHGIAYGSVGP